MLDCGYMLIRDGKRAKDKANMLSDALARNPDAALGGVAAGRPG